MRGKPKKTPRHKDMTSDYLSGSLDEDRIEPQQRFTARNKNQQQEKTLRTALMRAEEQIDAGDIENLPVGLVVQVYSLYSEVEHAGSTCLCVVRKTLSKVSDTRLIVGDLVRFRVVEEGAVATGAGVGDMPQAVIEQILPRKTVLARSDSFKAIEVHPIVANAEQMLIVASLHQPEVRWGLVDRMMVAAQSGGLRPIVCLNKVDLAESGPPTADTDYAFAGEALAHYESLGVTTLQTSVEQNRNIDLLRHVLKDRSTVLAGHSGVGKSSLINTVEPGLDIRVGAVSGYTNKGRHTTTFARRYPLAAGGHVIDTPGVKLFGLWGVTAENLKEFFPDLAGPNPPEWRRASFERILQSMPD